MVLAEVLSVYPPSARMQFSKPYIVIVSVATQTVEGKSTLGTDSKFPLGPLQYIIVGLGFEDQLAGR